MADVLRIYSIRLGARDRRRLRELAAAREASRGSVIRALLREEHDRVALGEVLDPEQEGER